MAWAGLLSPKVAARCRLRSKAQRGRAAPGTAHPQVTPINSSRLDRRAMLRMLKRKGPGGTSFHPQLGRRVEQAGRRAMRIWQQSWHVLPGWLQPKQRAERVSSAPSSPGRRPQRALLALGKERLAESRGARSAGQMGTSSLGCKQPTSQEAAPAASLRTQTRRARQNGERASGVDTIMTDPPVPLFVRVAGGGQRRCERASDRLCARGAGPWIPPTAGRHACRREACQQHCPSSPLGGRPVAAAAAASPATEEAASM